MGSPHRFDRRTIIRNLFFFFRDDEFSIVLDLRPGTYRFYFIVDDERRYSPEYSTVLDSDGNLVNYIEIPEYGIKPFELEEEEPSTSGLIEEGRDSLGAEMYSQTIPQWDDENGRVEEPPTLPPHLGNHVLNREPPIGSDRSLLQVPYHVGLHHLYALSMRYGVMVLATTIRYKKKYVTTVYYKPVIT
jgi:5'-AMP-activated protein kinase regulatory beta subunit